jgi:hypothetical protein
MKTVLSGKFENAILREITAANDPEAVQRGSKYSYYGSLFRPVSKSYFDRSGVFVAISNEISLPRVDWSARQGRRFDSGSPDFEDTSFGIVRLSEGKGEWDDEIETFAKLLLDLKIFSDATIANISVVKTDDVSDREKITKKDKYDFAKHHLCRFLIQIDSAREQRRRLVIGDEEKALIREIGAFLKKSCIPAPIDIPELTNPGLLNAEQFAGGLLNFSPPDAPSLIAVRADPDIQKYAVTVREILATQSNQETDRSLVRAMRGAMEKSDIAQRCETVFEVESWIAKPINYIPAIGNVTSMVGDAIDMLKLWLSRKKKNNSWFLLGAKMADISIRDYLRRKGNL